VSLTVGEEDKGQLRTLIALPISRRKIVFAKWIAIVIICLVASLAPVLGVELGVMNIQKSIDQVVLVRLGLFTWLLVTALATVIFSVGMSTGKRSLTTGIAIIVTIGSFLLTTFSQAVDWLKDYEWLSFFHYFPAVDIANGIIEWGNTLFYAVFILVALLVALVVFARRDVKTS